MKIFHWILLTIICLSRFVMYAPVNRVLLKDVALMAIFAVVINVICYLTRKILDRKTKNVDYIEDLIDDDAFNKYIELHLPKAKRRKMFVLLLFDILLLVYSSFLFCEAFLLYNKCYDHIILSYFPDWKKTPSLWLSESIYILDFISLVKIGVKYLYTGGLRKKLEKYKKLQFKEYEDSLNWSNDMKSEISNEMFYLYKNCFILPYNDSSITWCETNVLNNNIDYALYYNNVGTNNVKYNRFESLLLKFKINNIKNSVIAFQSFFNSNKYINYNSMISYIKPENVDDNNYNVLANKVCELINQKSSMIYEVALIDDYCYVFFYNLYNEVNIGNGGEMEIDYTGMMYDKKIESEVSEIMVYIDSLIDKK